jgi:hypothetical protein
MINAELQHGEYLLASADEWLADVAEFAPDITAAFCDVDDEADEYATAEVVLARMEALGYSKFTGIYGENDAASVSMCNEDHYLSDDLSFMFFHCEKDEWPHTFLIVNGSGYWQHRLSSCEVYEFSGTDDAEAFGYASAYVGCDTCDDADLVVEHNTIFRNGGGGERWDIASIVRVDESEQEYVPCPNPDCPSGRLHFMVG